MAKPTLNGNLLRLTTTEAPKNVLDDPMLAEIEHAERIVRFYLAMRGRHRVECYGEMRPHAVDEELIGEDQSPKSDDSAPCCSVCKKPMHCVSFGEMSRAYGFLYDWQPPRPLKRDRGPLWKRAA